MLVAPLMLDQDTPPLILTCHCTVTGIRLAVVIAKVARLVSHTVVLAGLVAITGAPSAVITVAALVAVVGVAQVALLVIVAVIELPFVSAASV